MDETLKHKIEEAVDKSGFPFEVETESLLRKHNWSVISNRYYIDDISGVGREIDVLAYKVHTAIKQKIKYYTVLIISCKKSENGAWCMLTQNAVKNNPNIDRQPFHFATDDTVLEYMSKHHKGFVFDEYSSHNSTKCLYNFNHDVISPQQCIPQKPNSGKTEYSLENKNIYDSISTVIKALDSEKRTIINHDINSEYKHYYSYYLVSLFDGELVECYFDRNGKKSIGDIGHINYLNRHIVNRQDDFYAVHFMTKDYFEKSGIRYFEALHKCNKTALPSLVDKFYENIFTDDDRVKVFWADFVNRLKVYIDIVDNEILRSRLPAICKYYYDAGADMLEIYLDCNGHNIDDIIQKINREQDNFNIYTKSLLNRIFRYDGKFVFTSNLPF